MRLLFKLIFAVITLIIIAAIALPFVIVPNDYKQEISDQVEKATGRTLQLDGDIKLSVFPWIALELGHLSLSNTKGFKSDSFAEVKSTQIRIKLIPLLRKQIEMDTLILDGLSLNLEKDKKGQTNWADLAGSSKPSTKASTSTNNNNATSQDNDAPALAAITIAGVNVINANIVFQDAMTSDRYQLENLNVSTGPFKPNTPTTISLDFNLSSAKPKATAHVTLTSTITVDLDEQHYALKGLKFTTQAEGQDLPFSKADISLNGDIDADMLTQLITVNDLSLTVNTNKDKQHINATLTSDISSNLANQKSNLKAVNLNIDIADPSLPGGKANLSLNADVSADMNKQTASISNLAIKVQNLLINGHVTLSKLLSETPRYAGNIKIATFNLRQLAEKLAIELPVMVDSSTLEKVQLSTEFAGSSNGISAEQLNVTLDQSTLKGRFAINNFASPAFDFKLALDAIDVVRYLPPVAKDDKKAAAPAAAGATQLPLEALRQINAKGSIDIAKLKVSGLHSEKVHLQINAAKGLVKLSPLSANLYQGQYKGNVNLDARGKTLKLAVNESLSAVQAGPLLNDLSGDDKFSGTANVHAKLAGHGATVEQIKATLTGHGKFSFVNGAIKGVNIAESIRKAKAAITSKKLPASNSPVKTDFASLSGSFTAKNGVINNQDFKAMSPLFRIGGAGKVDLAKENIDYGLKVSIVETSKGQAGKELADLKGLTIPVKITGTFDNPKPTVDLASMLKQQTKDKLKAKVADKLKAKLGGSTGDLVGDLLGITTGKEAAPEKSAEDQAKDALKDKLKSFF